MLAWPPTGRLSRSGELPTTVGHPSVRYFFARSAMGLFLRLAILQVVRRDL